MTGHYGPISASSAMTDDANLLVELRELATVIHLLPSEAESIRLAADRLASLIANQELNLQVCRDLIGERDALSAEVAEYRQSLNVLGERYDAKCEELRNLRDSERFKVD